MGENSGREDGRELCCPFYREREGRGERTPGRSWGRRRPSLANDGVGFLLIMERNGRGSNRRVHCPFTTSNQRTTNDGWARAAVHGATSGRPRLGRVRTRPGSALRGMGA
jgi:hypothetical protein